MSYQAYLDNIKGKTGLGPEDFKALAKQKDFLKPGVKAGDIVAWLKKDYGLGHGHAMAIVLLLKQTTAPRPSSDQRLDDLFGQGKAHWRVTYDQLLKKVGKFGDDVRAVPTDSYVSLLKGKKKFAVIAATADRMDVGLKLKGVAPGGRLEASGAWNSMVTHRVRVSEPKQLDKEVLSWLREACDAA